MPPRNAPEGVAVDPAVAVLAGEAVAAEVEAAQRGLHPDKAGITVEPARCPMALVRWGRTRRRENYLTKYFLKKFEIWFPNLK